MKNGNLLSMARALTLVSMVFALVGIAVTFQGYAQEGFSIKNADISTHTKAFCSPKEGMLYCEDWLVVEYGDESKVIMDSSITGSAFIDIENF